MKVRPTIEEELLAPAPRRLRWLLAVICSAIGLTFGLLSFWVTKILFNKPSVDAMDLVLLAGVAVFAVVFFVAAYRLALDRDLRSKSSLARGLFCVGGFFFLVAICFASLALFIGRFQEFEQGILSALILGAVSMGAAFAQRSKGRNGNDAT